MKVRLGFVSNSSSSSFSYLGIAFSDLEDKIKAEIEDTFLIELECWNIGIKLASYDNIFFSDNAIKWGYEQAITYCNNDERERLDWTTTNKPRLIMERYKRTRGGLI